MAAGFLSVSAAFAQTTIADWTFETAASTNGFATSHTTTPTLSADIGTGSSVGVHASSSTVWSVPAGNGSTHSCSANNWALGDYFQFSVSTVGQQNIIVTYDSTSSATGPRDFNFQYSTDGVNFTNYNTYTNGAVSWSASGNPQTVSTHIVNLIPVTAVNNAPVVYFRLVCASGTAVNGSAIATGGTSRVDNFIVATEAPPVISGVSPSTLTANAGTTASFTATLSSGTPPLTYYWYKETATTTNLISTLTTNVTTGILSLPNVLAANAASYQLVVSNASAINATSSVVTLNVTDPAINYQPVSQTGLLNGRVQFPVSAGGTGLSYQWYYCTSPSDNTQMASVVTNGTQGSGSIVSGATSSALAITNLQFIDPTNYVVVVTGTYGSVTSSVASFTLGTSQVPLAFWNFNNPLFNITNPAPYQGIGTASATNVVTFLQPTTDANDPMTPNTAWGTDIYPAQGTLNTNAGVQFSVSTLGAKDITVSYDVRGSGTASKYHRLQFTTNGTVWINYPASSSVIASGTSASIYTSFNYNLTGFSGVANNPNFGIRMVSEFESTASYGATNDAQYVAVGTTASYGTSGSLSYDLVTISGDAITNANQPPTISPLANVTLDDSYSVTNNFTVSDDTTPAGSLIVTPTCLNPSVSLSMTPVNTGGACQLIVSSSLGNTAPVVAPVLVTVTDANGDSAASWFYLTITPANAPPTISGLASTNMLVSTTLTLPFTLGDDHTDMSTVTPTATSGNSTLVSNDVAHVSFGGSGTNRTLIITPVANQSGSVPITVSVSDGSLVTSRTINVEVRKNSNILLVDNFTYDTGTAIDTESGGLWSQYSGTANQMVAGSGVVTIDGVNHTEDVQAPLIGAPYPTNSATVLYSKFYINYSTLPGTLGSYISYFTDGSTSNFVCRVWAFTNGAAAGDYRVGIAISTNQSTLAVPFPQDLVPGSNYLVVSRLVLSNSVSTLWVNPVSESSSSVTANDVNWSSATQFSDYDLRESTADEGILTYSNLVVGTTFNDVVGVSPADVSVIKTGPANVATSSNLTYTITVSNAGPSAASSVVATDSLPAGVTFVSASGGGVNNGGAVSWSFGTLAGSASSSVTVTVTATASGSLTNKATVSSSTADPNSANNTSAVITVVTNIPPLASPDGYTVAKNSVNNVFNPLTNDVVETSGGSLSLVSISPDSHGTATISGNQVLFTPAASFTGHSIIGYTVTDNVGGTNSSTITASVVNPPQITAVSQVGLNLQIGGICTSNGTLKLQSTLNLIGGPVWQDEVTTTGTTNSTFIVIPSIDPNTPQKFYRVVDITP
jgi:uncharacterized repeat protein (TIGR01451 family)